MRPRRPDTARNALFRATAGLWSAGTGRVASVTLDPALADQHDARLDLFEDGRWTWTRLRAESRSA